MKILEYGHVHPKHLRCNGCGARLEYTPNDVKVHTNQFHTYYYVNCPVCSKWCFVDDKGDSND